MATSDDPRIGDFSRPLVARPKEGAPAPSASPAKERLDAAERQLADETKKDEEALKPMASYEERLKEAGIDKAKAAAIIDAVLLQGFYAEDIKITARIKARFRTRSSRDTKRAQEILDGQRFTFDTHYHEALTRILLAASLEQFGDEKLQHLPLRGTSADDYEKAFQSRLSYVDTMPDPAMRLLFKKLSKFDQMVSIALEEGSVENF